MSLFVALNYMIYPLNIPFYKDWPFISILIIVGVLSLTVIIYYRAKRFLIRQAILKALVERKTKEIRKKNEELEKNDLIKTRLISIISHDIITPLRFLHISGKSLVEGREKTSEELQQETLVEIVNTSRELEMLTTNILNWIKYQNENRKPAKESFDLHEMVTHVFGIVSGLARQKNIILTNAIPVSFCIYQYIEPIKIIIYNLVVNAINFMDKGHITIEIKRLKNGLVIEVKDEGFGMTKDQISNIMGDQFIVSSANIDGKKGNGLGYLIIKDLLKLVEGGFSIKSAKNKGTSIKLFFPNT
ncbi:MAG: HAMP domain-containing histidine kinase [Bacteroidetes bacterium]|nr:HAMP domain-containing histidine kinase [Bacteroidota bacterium]